MEQYPLPTLGECARDALRHLQTVEVTYRRAGTSEDLDWVAGNLIRACMDLMEQFAPTAREAFAGTLPLTELELAMLTRERSTEDRVVLHALSHRFGEWITRSPVFVDESPRHVATFLARLRPNLDTWEERVHVDETITRATHLSST